MGGLETSVVIVIPVLAASVVLVWLIIHTLNNRYRRFMNGTENSVRSLVIDCRTRQVKFFNRNSIRKIRTVSLDQYYYQFSKADAARLDDWLNELVKHDSAKYNDTFEIEVRLHRSRKRYYSLLYVTNVNKDLKKINIDSYLFFHLSSRARLTYQLRNTSMEEAMNRLKIVTGLKGFTINFRFSLINKSGMKENITRLLFVQLKEIAAKFAVPPQRYIVDSGPQEFTIFDTHTTDREEGISYVHTVINEMRKFLEINSLIDNTIIAAGVVYNSFFPDSPKKLIEKAQEMSQTAYEKNLLVVTYSKNMLNGAEVDRSNSEIEHIVKEKRIAYSFQAVYDIPHQKVIGYIDVPIPNHANAKTMEDLYMLAVKTGENKKLLEIIVKDTYAAFNAMNNNSEIILFRLIKTGEADDFINLCTSDITKDTKSVICFDEFDISYYISKNQSISDIVTKYRNKNIGLGLILADQSLILDFKTYSSFDYFFVFSSNSKNRKTDNIVLNIKTIVEKLIKYNKPIILANVESWSLLEIFVRGGIQYVASPNVSPISTKLIEPVAKIKSKIKRMVE